MATPSNETMGLIVRYTGRDIYLGTLQLCVLRRSSTMLHSLFKLNCLLYIETASPQPKDNCLYTIKTKCTLIVLNSFVELIKSVDFVSRDWLS